jgi:hypothetical protein
MPKIEQTIADINVRSHTFEFISPTTLRGIQDAKRMYELSYGPHNRMGTKHDEKLV